MIINVSVLTILIGMVSTVKRTTVWVGKSGINLFSNVNAKLDIILMDPPVCSASMGKHGNKPQELVSA